MDKADQEMIVRHLISLLRGIRERDSDLRKATVEAIRTDFTHEEVKNVEDLLEDLAQGLVPSYKFDTGDRVRHTEDPESEWCKVLERVGIDEQGPFYRLQLANGLIIDRYQSVLTKEPFL